MSDLTFSRKLRYGAEATGFLGMMGLFRLLGLDGASAFGGWIGRNVARHLGMARTARRNLADTFPEKTSAAREAILTAMLDNLGRTFAEYAHLEKFVLGPRVAVTGEEHLRVAVARGKGVLAIAGHFANWEILPIAAAQSGYDGGIVYRPPNNPYVADYVARKRAARGYSEQISKHNGARRIFALLRAAKPVFMLVDQKTNEGIAAPFFGRDAMTTPVPAALALKLCLPLVFASNRRIKGAHFEVTVHPPLEFSPSGDEAADVRALTAVINAKVEETVRENPSQWTWSHRRWPTPNDVAGKRA
jgi:KDO2-lipid IV(A) lauroyltransferase